MKPLSVFASLSGNFWTVWTFFSWIYKRHLMSQTLSHRAIKTLWVVVAVESLHPAVTRLNREPASDALCREQLVPVWNKIDILLDTILDFHFSIFWPHPPHSKAGRPPGRKGGWRGSCRSRHSWSTQDGSWCPAPSNSSENKKIECG